MKICVAQTKPIPGNIQANVESHVDLIVLAVAKNADLIIFPELSLTGYEPELAKSLAININDARLDLFQKISDSKQITICIGAPTTQSAGINISMLIFLPHKPKQVYSKKYLHKDEEAWFVPGKNTNELISDTQIAPAICYEISIPVHAEIASQNGAKIYLASVAKSIKGVNEAQERLSEIAGKYKMTVLMANCVGPCENGSYECAGKSTVWDNAGIILGQLDKWKQGILVLDTKTQKITD